MSKSDNTNYYEQDTYPAVERATLAEKVTSSSLKNVTGKFFLKILTPDLDTSTPYDNASNKVKSGSYSSNYISLVIPAYMLICFPGSEAPYVIPKGTNFLVSFLGGDIEVEKMNIIGVEL